MSTSCIHYENYAWLVEKFGKRKIEERYALLATAYAEFIQKENLLQKVKLNGLLLGYAIMDYFSDIARIKDFHNIELVNEVKICAYENAWLLKRKPLQIIDPACDCSFCNEQFVFLRIVAVLSEGVPAKVDAFNQPQLRPFLESLFYFLKFRRVNPQTLELALQAFFAGEALRGISASTSDRGNS